MVTNQYLLVCSKQLTPDIDLCLLREEKVEEKARSLSKGKREEDNYII